MISKETISNNLKAITLPEVDIGNLELSDIIDIEVLQSMMDNFYQLTGMLGAVLDVSGKVLIAVGWQDICTKFHRCNPDTLKNCIESDTILTQGVAEGTFKAYQCKNHMWDIVTPIIVGGRHVGNVFMGQYFLEDQVPDVELFRKQAQEYGFDEKEYLEALDRVPRFSKETVDSGMQFYSKLAGIIATLSFNAIQQSKMLAERKIHEEELRKSEKKYRDLINLAQEGIWVIDKNNVTDFANPSMAKILQYSPEEMIGKSLFDFMDETAIKVANENIERRKAGLAEQHDFEFIRKNGDRIYCAMATSPILDKDGNYQGAIAGVLDITERNRTKELLQQNQRRYQKAQTMGHVGNWEYDPLTTLFWASDEAKRIYGFNPEIKDFTTENVESCIPEREPVHNALIDLIEHDKKYDLVFDILAADNGVRKTIHSIAEINRDAQGKPLKITGVVNDITKQKIADKEIKESEAKLNALFSSMTEMVVIHELVLNLSGEATDYRIIECNKVFTEVTGIPKEDAIGKLASQVYQTTPPPYLEKYAKVGLGGPPLEFKTFYPALNKHFMISVISPRNGVFATITTDISDIMQIQEKLISQNKEMENYLYITSHDLRTPLVNIQGFSQRLKKQADSIINLLSDKVIEPQILHQLEIITDEMIPKTLSFVLGNIEKMDSLINGLLQLSRTGRVDMNIQKIDMNGLFTNILQSLDFQIKEAQCEIHINPLPECYGDKTLLDQLFVNLISNALKYSDSERPLKITVDAEKKYNKIVYTIRDTGRGMTQKHLDKIWDVFYRIDPRSDKTGEGLGLSLVKRIAEKHKGKAWVESEENKGSIFHIELQNHPFTEI